MIVNNNILDSLERIGKEIIELAETIRSNNNLSEEPSKKVDLMKHVRLNWLVEQGILSSRICNALLRAGFKTVGDVDFATYKDLSHVRMLGKRGLDQLCKEFEQLDYHIDSNKSFKERLPYIEKGDIVYFIAPKEEIDNKSSYIDGASYTNLRPGCKLKVIKVDEPINSKHMFSLPYYECKKEDGQGGSSNIYFLSPNQIYYAY